MLKTIYLYFALFITSFLMKRFKLSVTLTGFTISQKYLYPFLKA